MEQQRRPGSRGPVPKGNRKHKSIAFEVEILDRVDDLVERDGVSRPDVINRLLSEALGMTPPAYSLPKPRSNQEELPMAEAS